jgi:hypothetical protein
MRPLALAPAQPNLSDLKAAARRVRADVLCMTHRG